MAGREEQYNDDYPQDADFVVNNDPQYEMGPGGQPYYEEDGDHGVDPDGELYPDAIPDMLRLNHYCANARKPAGPTEEDRLAADESWEPVREWLRSHNAEEVRAAAEQRGESSMTALHFACHNQPPLDVVNVFLSIAIETVQWPDTFGWLPIHYACACGAETEVIRALADAFPDSKTTVDRRGRTPLHFALGNQNPDRPASPDVVHILSSTGAASYADDNGMLPLHYACAYGASQESLIVLTDAHRPAIGTRDRSGRTPLHFALSNAGRPASPGAVRHLLDLDPKLANSNGGPLPLRVLAEFSQTLRRGGSEDDRASVQSCLNHLLLANPDPTADLFTALQSLPEWLSEQAVVLPSVQVLLNEKISQRFPTAVKLLDLYFLCMIIICYSYNIMVSIEGRFKDQGVFKLSFAQLSPLYAGAGYFFGREVIQMISLISLKSFHIWLNDGGNFVNAFFIIIVLYWTAMMQTGGVSKEVFRTGTALTVAVLWLKFLAFLRNMYIDFAVFAGGVFNVFRRLVAFLIVLMIILVGFTFMFKTIFSQSGYCPEDAGSSQALDSFALNDISCASDDNRPYCNYWDTFLDVYTMLLGEVDETKFESSGFATALFVLFMFLCVILLANVLIAIVTDSYRIIQDKRAAIVFWTSRLGFVAEMDAIANGPWKKRVKKAFGMDDADGDGHVDVVFGKEFWKRLMDLFEDDIDESVMSLEFWAYSLLRMFTAIVIIPAWVVLGIFSAGWLWPPQLREVIFTSAVSKHSSDAEREDEDRRTQVNQLQEEVDVMKEEMNNQLNIDRATVVQMKNSIAQRRTDITNEMKHIKRIMTMLFEQQSAIDA